MAVCKIAIAESESGTVEGDKSREEMEDAVCDIILEVGDF